MKITIIQSDIAWAQPAANRERLDAVLASSADTDLIVLPEMFSTGFATEPRGIAESDDSDTLRWMRDRARRYDCAVAGSVAVNTAETFVNRFYFVKPTGEVTHYDKHHLFTYGGEDRCFTAGQDKVTVAWRGVRIRLLVCYDLRFPVWSRNNAAEPYDLALYVASWPASRVEAWDTLLRARAIENQCYVAGINRVGDDPACHYCGSSAVIDPYGRVAAACGRETEGTASAVVDMEVLAAFRSKFPVLTDAD